MFTVKNYLVYLRTCVRLESTHLGILCLVKKRSNKWPPSRNSYRERYRAEHSRDERTEIYFSYFSTNFTPTANNISVYLVYIKFIFVSKQALILNICKSCNIFFKYLVRHKLRFNQ